ncbi:MAG: chloride channel protein [Gammaproteobacteria bacterium]|nr:chloride channel protein [Gammaproteobacteria bacterium]
MKESVQLAKRLLQPAASNRIGFFLLAGIVGVLVALATLVLIKMILLFQWLGYGSASEERFAAIASALPAWRVIVVPALGGLLVGVLLMFMQERRYHGIADVMEASALNSARMSARSGIVAAVAASVSLGVGAPLGREGPAVHIGASLSSVLADWLNLDRNQSLALLGCGAAAAVTMSFNAPIAAVIFALEVIVGYYTLRVFAPVVVAAMLAFVVRDAAFGNTVQFDLPEFDLVSLWELVPFALLGVCGALVARALIVLSGTTANVWARLSAPIWIRPAVAGLLIGVVAVQLPMVLSIGYEGTLQALRGELESSLLIQLLVAKLLLVGLAIGSGFAGGVFGPAIFLGALLGGAFWLCVSWICVTWLGLPLAEQGVYAVVGMAAVASALLGAPISTILIVFELTHNYSLVVGVMMAAAVASATMQQGKHSSFFRWQLARRHVNITAGRDISLLMTHQVKPLISDRYTTHSATATLGELESHMGTRRQRLAMLVDDNGGFVRSVALSELVSYAIENGLDYTVASVGQDADYSVTETTNIVAALQLMAERQLEYVPVVDKQDDELTRLVGVVYKSDLLAEHYDVVKRAREEEFGIT